MEILKAFYESKGGQRALWTLLNSAMSLIIALVAFLATDNVTWAVTVLPFAQALSQWFTKEIINKQ